jgi:hypothetical protein
MHTADTRPCNCHVGAQRHHYTGPFASVSVSMAAMPLLSGASLLGVCSCKMRVYSDQAKTLWVQMMAGG